MNGSFLGLALINVWYIPWVNLDKIMVHSLGWTGQEEESWWKNQDNYRKISVGLRVYEL
jgi:hypothetical protein